MAVSSYIPPLLIAEGHLEVCFLAKRNGGLDLLKTAVSVSDTGKRTKSSARQRFFSFPRCGGRCFILIYHKHNLQMLYKLPTAKRIASRIDGTGITTIRMTLLLAASMNVPKTPRSTPSFSVGRLFKVTAGRMDVSKGLLYDGFFLLPPFNKSIHI